MYPSQDSPLRLYSKRMGTTELHAIETKAIFDCLDGGLYTDLRSLIDYFEIKDDPTKIALKRAIWIGYCRGFEDGKAFQ